MKIKKMKIYAQYVLPKHFLTRIVGILAAAKLGMLTTLAIKAFVKIYKINLHEMSGDVKSFKTFNDFFARALKVGMRPINEDEKSIVFPADGRISAFGQLKGDVQLQAKGH